MKNSIEWWVAGMPDGSEMNSVSHGSIESVHAAGGCAKLSFKVEGIDAPFHVSCDHAAGERIKLFTRRALKIGAGAAIEHADRYEALVAQGEPVNMPVAQIERWNDIAKHPDRPSIEVLSSLYIHPVHGPLFSTRDIRL